MVIVYFLVAAILVVFLYYVAQFTAAVRSQRRHSRLSEEAKSRMRASATEEPRPSPGSAAGQPAPPDNAPVSSPASDSEKTARLEIALLRALCHRDLPGKRRKTISARLAGYRFTDAIRQVVFEELAELTSLPEENLRPELAACLTRRGFPDVDFDAFFAPADERLDPDVLLEQLLPSGGK